ncbi:MAG: hypothetical protein U0Y82_04625 [Thermoleophilia bacterium]
MSDARLTDDDVKLLRSAAMRATALVSIADRGFLDTFKEAFAASKSITHAPENVRGLVAGGMPSLPHAGSPAEMETAALDTIRQAGQLLAAKAPDLHDPYRDAVLGAVRDVAAAAGGTSQDEQAAIDKVTQALG